MTEVTDILWPHTGRLAYGCLQNIHLFEQVKIYLLIVTSLSQLVKICFINNKKIYFSQLCPHRFKIHDLSTLCFALAQILQIALIWSQITL